MINYKMMTFIDRIKLKHTISTKFNQNSHIQNLNKIKYKISTKFNQNLYIQSLI